MFPLITIKKLQKLIHEESGVVANIAWISKMKIDADSSGMLSKIGTIYVSMEGNDFLYSVLQNESGINLKKIKTY